MKITLDGWFNLSMSLLMIILFILTYFNGYKKKKNRAIDKIIYIDKLKIMYILGIIFSLICIVFFVFCIVTARYNRSNVAMPFLLLSGFNILNLSNRIIISDKGIGKRNLFGNINLFVEWNNIEEYKWTGTRLKLATKINNKSLDLLMGKFSNKDEIVNYIRQYDSRYAEQRIE